MQNRNVCFDNFQASNSQVDLKKPKILKIKIIWTIKPMTHLKIALIS